MNKMRYIVEATFSLIVLISLTPILIFISLLIKINSKGPALFWSERSGKDGVCFYMPKFRTMYIETPQVATHLLSDPDSHLTSVGKFLRRYSIDEFPQLISVFTGKMSLVGPRPALFNQFDLIDLRRMNKIDKDKPGITYWAQVNGRDQLSIEEKIKFEKEYIKRKSIIFDLYIIWLTILKVFKREGVHH